ncbi:MAG: AAA family ATPase [Flavobacteriaceae bacterium]|nr:AAA family ATPase [Flavobacteriaceae bacterium]
MDYIEIEGYKSINSERIDLKPINILIGANGSGKSNFISFFDFLNRLCNRNLNHYIALSGGSDKILHKGQKTSNKISFKVEFSNGRNGYSVKLESGVDGFVFVEERLIHGSYLGYDISYSDREARIKITDSYGAKYIIDYLNGLRKYHFHDSSSNSPFTRLSSIDTDIYYLYNDGANLAAFLYEIRKSDTIVYNLIVKTIQSIAPYFLDFYFEANSKGLVRLLWIDKYSDITYGATNLSDGTIRFIALTVLFMQPKLPKTIIIDEPELGLHPSSIAKLAGMIKSVAAKGSQVIIATQSTDLLSHFSPEDILTVDQVNGESKFKRLSDNELREWLEDYTIDDLWKRNIITTGQPNYTLNE